MNNQTVDSVVKRRVSIKMKFTSVILIARQVDSLAINNVTLVPHTVVFIIAATACWQTLRQ